MEFIGTGTLVFIVAVVLGTMAWVAVAHRQPSGLWWAAAGGLLALDGIITVAQQPAFLVPYAVDAVGPFVAWLAYRGATSFVGRPPDPWAARLALGSIAGWLALFHFGPPGTSLYASMAGTLPLVAATIFTLLRDGSSSIGRLVAASLALPVLLILAGPWTRRPMGERTPEIEVWLCSIIPIALLVTCALLERNLRSARQALEESNRKLRLAAQVGRLGVWSYERGARRPEWSSTMFEVFGMEPGQPEPPIEEQLGLVAEEDRNRYDEAVQETFRSGRVLDIEFGVMRRDGGLGRAVSRAQRMEVPGGGLAVIGSTVDVTEQRKAVHQLERYRNQLEEIVSQRTAELEASQQKLRNTERLASIGTLSAGLAHQVNNPVGSILAAADYAARCQGEADELEVLRQAVADIRSEAGRCGEIVRGMLQFASDRPTDKKVVALDPLLENLRRTLGRKSLEHGATLSLECQGASPLVAISTIEVEQALTNLIENAFQSGESGVSVTVRRTVEGERVRIEIQDDGCGISPEEIGRVLDPFYTSRLEAGGTGLGLSIAHGIAQEHGGDLQIESSPGGGTRVSFILPLAH